ncbi:hypothetical protein Stuart_16 [Providencia phage vB_PstP_PS3]|uniref:Uncharacterized protein n=1 Tax=Providencia phage vB_PstP_PS3 TaxID=2848038 RepID=A0A411AWE8_9CAUD|nr:hypothetical protein HOV05_gp16 [Providencia phage vB_PstP_PS3]QAX92431.1 hypothetical protein Stuart_16 [Providencia phage vB_PstP_PS3]
MSKVLKPHEYKELLKAVYSTAVLYRNTQQLRERLNTELRTELGKLGILIDE